MRITTLASVVIPCLGFSASSIAAAEDVMIGKRKLTAVCSHQTRIGNLDAHLI